MFTFLESDLGTEHRLPPDCDFSGTLEWKGDVPRIPSDRPEQVKDFARFAIDQAQRHDWWEHMIGGSTTLTSYSKLFGDGITRDRYHREGIGGTVRPRGKYTEAKYFTRTVATSDEPCGTLIDPTGINFGREVGQEDEHDRSQDHFPVGYQPLDSLPQVILTPDQLTDQTRPLPRLRQVPNGTVVLFGDADSHAGPFTPSLESAHDKRGFMTLRFFPRETVY